MSDLNEKLAAIRHMLAEESISGVAVEKQMNFSWLTGGRGFVGLASDNACGTLIVTQKDAVLLADNIEAQRLSNEETGWGFRDFLWSNGEERLRLLKEIAGENYRTDTQLAAWFYTRRTKLSEAELSNYRKAGRECASILEDCMRKLKPGKTELDLAGELSSRFWANSIEPITLLVAFDERAKKYRHPVPTGNKLQRYAMGVICGRYKGLIVSATRLVHFGTVADEIQKKTKAAATADAIAINATRPGQSLGKIFDLICDSYSATGYPREERLHHQGGLTGYMARENRVLPGTAELVREMQAYAWNPSISGAKSEDTILVLPTENEVITHTGDWLYINCEGLLRPDVLVL